MIALIRHGRSAHVQRGWMNVEQFRRWREAYESAAIADDEMPPVALRDLVARADLIVSSDAPRAIASATLLAAEREIVISPLLRELDLHPPDLGRLRLPLLGWAIAIGAHPTRSTPEEIERIDAAATWLSSMEHVVAVTHASVRRRIAKELLARGWRMRSRRRSMQHWSAWSFQR